MNGVDISPRTAVDAIVLDIDGGAMLEQCVASLRTQTHRPARIIVYDNGSESPVSERLTGVEIVRSETNRGFTGGVNAAFAESSAPFIALVNNDVVLDPDWLATLVAELTANSKLAAAQTIVRRNATTIDGAGIDISDGTFRQIGHGLPVGSELPEAWGVSATAAVYRVSALGGRVFDGGFFAYYEDVELSARLRAAGWSLRVLPVAKATHRGSQSASRVDARYLRTRNRYRVARMHKGIGNISALLEEDLRLLLRGRGSLRGIIAGMAGPLRDDR
jgi:GT2 family glycosyltransferase